MWMVASCAAYGKPQYSHLSHALSADQASQATLDLHAPSGVTAQPLGAESQQGEEVGEIYESLARAFQLDWRCAALQLDH
jgi:hypothetical protein